MHGKEDFGKLVQLKYLEPVSSVCISEKSGLLAVIMECMSVSTTTK